MWVFIDRLLLLLHWAVQYGHGILAEGLEHWSRVVILIGFILQRFFAIFTTHEHRLFQIEFITSRTMVILHITTACASAAMFVAIYYVPLMFHYLLTYLTKRGCVCSTCPIYVGGLAQCPGFNDISLDRFSSSDAEVKILSTTFSFWNELQSLREQQGGTVHTFTPLYDDNEDLMLFTICEIKKGISCLYVSMQLRKYGVSYDGLHASLFWGWEATAASVLCGYLSTDIIKWAHGLTT